jgi:hypothetical protein
MNLSRTQPVVVTRLMLVALLIALLVAGCAHAPAASQGSTPGASEAEATPSESSAESSPETSPAPDADSPPPATGGEGAQVTPAPLDLPQGGPLEHLPLRLGRARAVHLQRLEAYIDDLGSEVLVEVMSLIREDTTLICQRLDGGRAACWSAPIAARLLLHPEAHNDGDGLVTVAAISLPDSQLVHLRVDARQDVVAEVANPDGTTAPFAGFVPAPVPPIFDELRGLTVYASSGGWLVRHGDAVAYCQREESALTCTAPIEPLVLQGPGRRITDCADDFPGLVSIEVMWGVQEGDVFEVGQAIEYLRHEQQTLGELSLVVLSLDRTSRASVDNDDFEIVEMAMFDIEARRATCFVAGAPTIGRRMELANGGERTLRAPRLRRAPSSVPVEGVDPHALSMEGSWEFQPGGGLRRIRSCDYDDDL